MRLEDPTLFDVDRVAPPPAAEPGPARRRGRETDALPGARVAAPQPPASGEKPPPEQHRLPPTLDVVTAGAILGVGRTVAYRLVRNGQWPTHVVRAGGKIMIPTLPLLAFLGIDSSNAWDGVLLSTSVRVGLGPGNRTRTS